MAHLGPYELALTLRGARERSRDQLRQTAWLVATFINVMSTSKVSVGELLGEEVAPKSIAEAEALAAATRDAAVDAAGAGWADDVDGSTGFDDDDDAINLDDG